MKLKNFAALFNVAGVNQLWKATRIVRAFAKTICKPLSLILQQHLILLLQQSKESERARECGAHKNIDFCTADTWLGCLILVLRCFLCSALRVFALSVMILGSLPLFTFNPWSTLSFCSRSLLCHFPAPGPYLQNVFHSQINHFILIWDRFILRRREKTERRIHFCSFSLRPNEKCCWARKIKGLQQADSGIFSKPERACACNPFVCVRLHSSKQRNRECKYWAISRRAQGKDPTLAEEWCRTTSTDQRNMKSGSLFSPVCGFSITGTHEKCVCFFLIPGKCFCKHCTMKHARYCNLFKCVLLTSEPQIEVLFVEWHLSNICPTQKSYPTENSGDENKNICPQLEYVLVMRADNYTLLRRDTAVINLQASLATGYIIFGTDWIFIISIDT